MQRQIRDWYRWGLGLLALSLLPSALSAQVPPPNAFVRFLDLRCYNVPNQPPINVPLRLDHLNPYFQSLGLPEENVILQRPEQLCVPVAKDDFFPPDDIRRFISQVDLKCYGIDGPPLDLDVRLDQLNPVISGAFGPEVKVTVREPEQLCVPVAKNQRIPPPAVLDLVQWLDLKCYRVESDQILNGPIRLTHLNPLFANIPTELAQFVNAQPVQLCVPVAKDKQFPPHNVYNQVAYSDVLCYKLAGLPLNWNLRLDHLNPVLRAMGLPPEFVWVTDSQELCVPVAKEGWFPPAQ